VATKASDNRYGQVKYNQTKYGASALRDGLAWGIEFDWDGDGVYEENESDRMTAIQGFRGRKNFLSTYRATLEPQETGRYVLTLDDYDRRYDPWNTSSPLYGNLVRGKFVRISVRNLNDTDGAHPVMAGVISDIEPQHAAGGERTTIITVEDGWSILRTRVPRVPVPEDAVPTVDNCSLLTFTDAALTSIQWPSRWGRASWNADLNFKFLWAQAGLTVGELLYDFTTPYFAQVWIMADGSVNFQDYIAVDTDIPVMTESDFLKDLQISRPLENYRNLLYMTSYPRALASSGVIWQLLGDVPSIADGATLTLIARYAYGGVECPAKTVLQPVASTDWTTNTAADGSGTNKTADCTCVLTDYGDRGMLEITNNSGGVVYLTTAQVKGIAIYLTFPIAITAPSDEATVQNQSAIRDDSIWLQRPEYMKSYADDIVASLMLDTPSITAKMVGRPDVQLDFELFDRIECDFTSLQLDETLEICGLAHESLGSCNEILTTMYLIPYITNIG